MVGDLQTVKMPLQQGLKRPPRRNDARVKLFKKKEKARQPEKGEKRDETARSRSCHRA